MDDNKIIDLLFERSEQGIAELSNKYEKIIKQIINNILNNDSDTQECINDTYLAIWNNIPPENPKNLSAYIYKIARNTALNKYHANTAQKRNSKYDVALEELSDVLNSPQTTESEYNQIELSFSINEFLKKLDTESQNIFVRRYWYFDSVNDIAKNMKRTPNSISLKLLRIKNKLRKFLITKGYDL